MKSFKSFFLLLFVGIRFCHAQDTTLLLKPNMLDKDSMQIFIGELKGWLFKQGNDTAWAKKDIDLTGWKRLMPTELNEKMADKNGRVEGWFRLKIKIDSSFTETAYAVRISTWAASDLYIDGNRVASFGNTGLYGSPYQENKFAGNLFPVPVNLKPGNNYTFVLHVVDYLSPFPPYDLKATDLGLRNLIKITVPKYYETIVPEATNGIYIFTIFSVISAVLSLLFWLLFLQNRREKNLLLFAVTSTFLTVLLVVSALSNNSGIALGGMSYSWLWVCTTISQFSSILYFSSIPVILARIFERKIPVLYRISVFCLVFLGVISIIRLIEVDENIITALNFMLLSFFIVLSVYYVVSSWKKLRGAQWSIVAGLLITLLGLFLIGIIEYVSQNTLSAFSILAAVVFLSFPFSLMVYVVIRFKEIIKDVQENARQVVQMSEEKKEQAINQQKILQEEVNRQTAEIRITLDHLKSTQSQLIQSEKMASLGELTAGIAHEIQNPLNFVNNFSELSVELAKELKEEVEKLEIPEKDKEYVSEIIGDLTQNQEKINHHGKRASSIVKGMLEHSRKSSGTKEPTDINTLADEYLRLAYHGLRAKDKSFNASMETHFDPTLPKIDIIPQDIGRVLLNLITNAFYAVNERSKKGENGYEPTISINTLRVGSPLGVGGERGNGNHIQISVSDNGYGIPEAIKDKIFQPFFTTKPTGQGTGLGLSLAYDIVKAHGGDIRVISSHSSVTEKPQIGSEFIITLPIV